MRRSVYQTTGPLWRPEAEVAGGTAGQTRRPLNVLRS